MLFDPNCFDFDVISTDVLICICHAASVVSRDQRSLLSFLTFTILTLSCAALCSGGLSDRLQCPFFYKVHENRHEQTLNQIYLLYQISSSNFFVVSVCSFYLILSQVLGPKLVFVVTAFVKCKILCYEI